MTNEAQGRVFSAQTKLMGDKARFGVPGLDLVALDAPELRGATGGRVASGPR